MSETPNDFLLAVVSMSLLVGIPSLVYVGLQVAKELRSIHAVAVLTHHQIKFEVSQRWRLRNRPRQDKVTAADKRRKAYAEGLADHIDTQLAHPKPEGGRKHVTLMGDATLIRISAALRGEPS